MVGDDAAARAVTSQELAAAGFRVVQATAGLEALDAVVRDPPDIVLLCAGAPDLDGFETCRRLRTGPGGEGLPILMVIGADDPAAMDAAFEAGATDFTIPPIQPPLLAQHLRFLIRASSFLRPRQGLAGLAERERRLADGQRIARIATWEWCLESDELLWSEEMFRLVHRADGARAPSRRALLDAVHPDERSLVEQTINEAVHEAKSWSLEHRLVGPDGGIVFVQHYGDVTTDPSTGETRVVATLQDTTERRNAEEKIRRLAFYDSLTGLPNRRMLSDRLSRLLLNAGERSRRVALLFLDLDRFKLVNDSMGHATGDRLLCEVASRLVGSLRHGDGVFRIDRRPGAGLVSRFGGDEFVIMFPLQGDPQIARKVAERLFSVLSSPLELDGQQLVVTGSIGIAIFPDDATDQESLLRCADAAMYKAKSKGRNQYHFFTPELSAIAARSLSIQTGLQRAVQDESFQLRYQVQVALRTGKIRSLEALVRWTSPELGEVSPGEFIPIAEETGLVLPIGEWVLRQACRDCRAWQGEGLPEVGVAVNVSPVQLRRPGLVELVRSVLAENGLEPRFLELEVTETALLDDTPEVTQQLDALKAMGVELALDDFGTGYASLSTLKRVPFDSVKIDRGFVSNITTDPGDRAIVSAIVAIARTFGLRVVAEGVETAVHESLIRQEGCDAMQGYWIGRPIPYEEVIRMEPPTLTNVRVPTWSGAGTRGGR